MDSKNLLEQVSSKCLALAVGLLESKTVLTVETVETARELIEMALSINPITHRRIVQSECSSGMKGHSGHTFRQKAKQD